MRRRGNQAYTSSWMSCLCNPRVHLLSRKLSSFTRFCALGHLDLDLLGAYQITAGNTETAGSYLLDRRTTVVVRRSRYQTIQAFTTFTCIWLAMDPVHGDCQCLMCFLGNRTIRHSTSLKTAYNRIYAFYLLNGDTAIFRIIKVHKISQMVGLALIVQRSSILLENAVIASFGCFLKEMDS